MFRQEAERPPLERLNFIGTTLLHLRFLLNDLLGLTAVRQ